MISHHSSCWRMTHQNSTYLSMNRSTKSSNSAEAEHISLSTWKSEEIYQKAIRTSHLSCIHWQGEDEKRWFTSVKSVLSCRADEQSTKGTRVTNVAINWNVIDQDRWSNQSCLAVFFMNLFCRRTGGGVGARCGASWDVLNMTWLFEIKQMRRKMSRIALGWLS